MTTRPTVAAILTPKTAPVTREMRMLAWLARNCKPQTTDTAKKGVQQAKPA